MPTLWHSLEKSNPNHKTTYFSQSFQVNLLLTLINTVTLRSESYVTHDVFYCLITPRVLYNYSYM
jgi:hypothetical protein